MFCLDNKSQVFDIVDVEMKVVFISGVVFVDKRGAFDGGSFGVFFNVVNENLFAFIILLENVLIE